MLCPTDKQPIKLAEKNNIAGYCCGTCNGAFLHGTSVKMFKFNYDTEVLNHLKPSADSSNNPTACPACQHKMTLKTIDEIELDVCANCDGIWFDPNELEQMVDQYGRINKSEQAFIEVLLACPLVIWWWRVLLSAWRQQ